jgi:hypothetical protein
MTYKISVPKRDIHLAAFMKAHGAVLSAFKDNKFFLESDIPEMEWRVRHAASDALKVDQELLTLRRFVVV